MKKIFALLLILLLCLPYNVCYAANTLPDSAYTDDGKIKTYPSWYGPITDGVQKCTAEMVSKKIPEITFYGADETTVEGTMTYPNLSDAKPGLFDLQWVFTPNDPKYEGQSGVFHYDIYDIPAEPTSVPEEPTPPFLTATSVQLLTKSTAYDININNKPSGASYSWTSSDPSVVEVNSKNGKIKALKEGKSTITCNVTYEDGAKETLKSIVNVGYDENAPVLTEDDLSLSVGDAYDINLENTVAKSKYRWVSSNKNVVKVNSLNGKVTAVSLGSAYVTCTITTPDKQVIVLKCDINVTE